MVHVTLHKDLMLGLFENSWKLFLAQKKTSFSLPKDRLFSTLIIIIFQSDGYLLNTTIYRSTQHQKSKIMSEKKPYINNVTPVFKVFRAAKQDNVQVNMAPYYAFLNLLFVDCFESFELF